MKLFVVIEEQGNQVLDVLAREALSAAAAAKKLEIEISISPKGQALRIPVARDKNDVLLLVSDNAVPIGDSDYAARFNGGGVHNVRLQEVLKDAAAIVTKLGTLKVGGASLGQNHKGAEQTKDSGIDSDLGGIKNIVAITSCPTGIAHTFMAADALLDSGKALGINIRVETQGSVGAGTPLTAEEIKNADLVIIAADREVDRSRFAGKRLYASGTKAAINKGVDYIKEAANNAKIQINDSAGQLAAKDSSGKGLGVYKHLMNGISFMLPFVVVGGLFLAIAMSLGGIDVGDPKIAFADGSFANKIFYIGSHFGLQLMVPILSGYIAFSIADRPGLAPGVIGGFLALQIESGFIGGIASGFLAGYLVLAIVKYCKLPRSLSGLLPVLIIPIVASFFVSIAMLYVIGRPATFINLGIQSWLGSIQGTNAALVGLVIGAMMAFDFGGPVNKAAYASSVALISQGLGGPMAAAMIAGMIPPMAIACAAGLFPKYFTNDECSSKVATFILGLVFVSEGAIPTVARAPFRAIPALMAGSAIAGAIAYGMGTSLSSPHGGIFVLLIPNAVTNYFGYFAALLSGLFVSVACLRLFMQPVVKQDLKAMPV